MAVAVAAAGERMKRSADTRHIKMERRKKEMKKKKELVSPCVSAPHETRSRERHDSRKSINSASD